MNFEFRACTLDQPLLLAPSLQQWLPEGHLARFIADVTEQLWICRQSILPTIVGMAAGKRDTIRC